jgi:hypothetical protein
MEFPLHNVIFNVFVYIFQKFEINLMNAKYPKFFETIKKLINGFDLFFLKMTYF